MARGQRLGFELTVTLSLAALAPGCKDIIIDPDHPTTSDGMGASDGDDDADTSAGGDGSSELCQGWRAHADECGLGENATSYCDDDVDIAMSSGPECQSAIDDYYTCLTNTDCATLQRADADTCDWDDVSRVCMG